MGDDGRERLKPAHIMGGDVHGDHQQDEHQRHGNPREQVQAFEADDGGEAEAKAEQDHQRNRQSACQTEHLHQHDRHCCCPPGIPAQFGEPQ